MLSEHDIKTHLLEAGVAEAEIPSVMRDVAEVILAKVSVAFIEALPEQERLRVRALDPSRYQNYLEENAASLPRVTQEQFDAIHDETWREYFASIG